MKRLHVIYMGFGKSPEQREENFSHSLAAVAIIVAGSIVSLIAFWPH